MLAEAIFASCQVSRWMPQSLGSYHPVHLHAIMTPLEARANIYKPSVWCPSSLTSRITSHQSTCDRPVVGPKLAAFSKSSPKSETNHEWTYDGEYDNRDIYHMSVCRSRLIWLDRHCVALYSTNMWSRELNH